MEEKQYNLVIDCINKTDTLVELTEEEIALNTHHLSPEDYQRTVERLIRNKYSISDELALHRQRLTKEEEYNEYYVYCEECKLKAKQLCGIN